MAVAETVVEAVVEILSAAAVLVVVVVLAVLVVVACYVLVVGVWWIWPYPAEATPLMKKITPRQGGLSVVWMVSEASTMAVAVILAETVVEVLTVAAVAVLAVVVVLVVLVAVAVALIEG